jgi:hypothetical protein
MDNVAKVNTIKYFNSAFISIVNMLAAIIITGIFSRYLNEPDFVDYLIIHRWLGFYVALCGGGYGYAISKYLQNNGSESMLRYGVIIVIVPFFLLLPIFYTYIANSTVFIYIWVVSQALFHVLSSYYRAAGRVGFADALSLLTKSMLFIFVAMLCRIIGLDYDWYFVLTGLAVLIILLWLLYSVKKSGPTGLFVSFSDFIYFGISRYVENLIRLAYPVSLVYLSVGILGAKEGAYVSIIFVLLKAFESLLQPILMNFYNNKNNFISSKSVFVGIFILSIVAPFIVNWIGEFFLLVWLGDSYVFLNEYLYLISFIVFPILYSAVFKVSVESSFRVSPIMFVNIISFFPLVIFYFDLVDYVLNIEFLIHIVIATYWMKIFILYGFYLFARKSNI